MLEGVLRLDMETLEIIGVTLKMALCSTGISAALGITLGLLLEKRNFYGKQLIVKICYTLMSTPPVVVGLVAYLLLMRRGPLGSLQLLFTVPGMVFAQVLIITPIITGLTYSNASRLAPPIRAFARTMGASRWQTHKLLISEMSNEMYFALISGFSRAISEVGSVMIVGGNIQYKTRTMTTAISLMRNRGEYEQAITLGIALLGISFIMQYMAGLLRKEAR